MNKLTSAIEFSQVPDICANAIYNLLTSHGNGKTDAEIEEMAVREYPVMKLPVPNRDWDVNSPEREAWVNGYKQSTKDTPTRTDAVEFAEWITINNWEWIRGSAIGYGFWRSKTDLKTLSMKDLYQLFLTQKTSK